MIADLHTHTLHSDGTLTPAELVCLARARGVQMLAVTDHDGIDAYADEALRAAAGVQIISGIELSTKWRRQGIHVVGLNVDLHHPTLRTGIDRQRAARVARAEKIGHRLARLGIAGALDGARREAPTAYLGRPHFAAFLIRAGHVADHTQAFKKYLGAGKPGDIKSEWAELAEAVTWIRAAGGVAVLAHPAKYKMTRTRRRLLIREFAAAGGEAMEVISGRQTYDVTTMLARDCREAGLLASCGSDFHRSDRRWAALGEGLRLPGDLTPVWSRWSAAA